MEFLKLSLPNKIAFIVGFLFWFSIILIVLKKMIFG